MSPYPISLWEPFKDRQSELVPALEQAHDQYWINELTSNLVLEERYTSQMKLPTHGVILLVGRSQCLWVMQNRILMGLDVFL